MNTVTLTVVAAGARELGLTHLPGGREESEKNRLESVVGEDTCKAEPTRPVRRPHPGEPPHLGLPA